MTVRSDHGGKYYETYENAQPIQPLVNYLQKCEIVV